MAWFARSIANSLKIDEDEDDDKKEMIKANSTEDSGSDQPSSVSPTVLQSQSPRGVKEDISELTKTFRSQLWGVASFLAPPPASSETADHVEEETRKSSDLGEGDEDLIAGIRNDFVEIGGRFRTGISKLSGNLPVSEFTKIASNFLQLGSEGADLNERDVVVGDAIGVTEEVVGFARDLALHPETWLDFPFPDEDDNFDDFDMTDAQYEHALAVERLASSLAALRIELCPAYMSENCFWRIYFVLVHPKFSKHDALLLSTPQVLEARALLSHELLNKRNKATIVGPESTDTGAASASPEPLSVPANPSKPEPESEPVKTISVETIHSSETSEFETEKHAIESKEIQVVDKPVIEERPKPACQDKLVQSPVTDSSPRVIDVQVDDDVDDWLKDEDNAGTVSAATTNHLVQDEDEDVSFSDLEEDDDEVPVSYKK